MYAPKVRLRPAWAVFALLVCLHGAPAGAAMPATPVASDFHTLIPCRLVDTRLPDDLLAGPVLAAGAPRAFDLTAASCGVPMEATAVSLNVTAVLATGPGSLTVYAGTGAVPAANTVSFASSAARASNAIVGLVAGTLSVASLQPSGTVHLILDVNGYFAPRFVAPPSITYSSGSYTFTTGVAISALVPSNAGGPVATWSISPALPSGLLFDLATGTISGTPTAVAASAGHTVTATNAGGSSQATPTITVNPQAPSITYSSGSYTFTTGTAISALVPSNSGGPVAMWSISSALPSGLVFDLATGTISGTPSSVAASAGHTVTATNAGGSSSVTPTITVNPQAPSIDTPPSSLTVDIGELPSFSVTASGTGTLTYQWWRDSAPIPGATLSVYQSPATAFADSGALFAVVVTDAWGGSATSAPATLTVRPDLETWLSLNPNVAAAIKWQFQPANDPFMGSYAPPLETDKIAWAAWSPSQKDDLNQAFLEAKAWLEGGAPQAAMPIDGLSDTPANQHPGVSDPTGSVMEWVTPAYMWKLYVAHVAFSLALEITQTVPWSITSDTDETLRYLFDSSVMAWYLTNGNYGMGTYAGPAVYFPALRANNRPQTAFAPPMWTYPFLKQAGLVGATRLETVGNVLQWMRADLWHFFGAATMGNYDAIWQYRGFVPLSKIVNGSVDANNPVYGVEHWTAGCHGSVAFLHEVLRVVNVPVQPVWISGHELAYFTSEKLYLDHGDDPYNAVPKSYPASPILQLLIDETTYKAWFTTDITINIKDPASPLWNPALANVGRQAANFH